MVAAICRGTKPCVHASSCALPYSYRHVAFGAQAEVPGVVPVGRACDRRTGQTCDTVTVTLTLTVKGVLDGRDNPNLRGLRY
jgi:hypothetical protein